MDANIRDKELNQDEFESTYKIDDFEDFVGKGTFAKVKLATNRKEESCNQYAVKIVDLWGRSTKQIEMRKREKNFVHLNHQNVIKFFHYSFSHKEGRGKNYNQRIYF